MRAVNNDQTSKTLLINSVKKNDGGKFGSLFY